MNRNLDLLLAILPGVKKMVLVALENFFFRLIKLNHAQTHQLATSTCRLNQTYFVVLHVKTEAKFLKRSKGVPALQLNEYAMQILRLRTPKSRQGH